MAGRALAFANDDIVRMAKNDFIPVAIDDWYQRRRDDAEGKFFIKVADQGPRKGQGGSTRQGIYCLTADGELLAYKNAGQAPDVMREVFKDALKKWEKLPAERRKPGAVKVEDGGKEDANYVRKPPAGGLVVNVSTRILDRDKGKEDCFVKGTCPTRGGDRAARDHLWLTAAEIKSLVPEKPKVGESAPVPAAVADRILMFHLIDNTRGEPPFWDKRDIRKSQLTLTVTAAGEDAVELRLDGTAVLATDADLDKAARGFDVKLRGELRCRPARKTFDRFDVVAVGDHWGQGTYTGGARKGKSPLGVVFELATGDKPGDSVPPQAAREKRRYFGTDEGR